MPSFTGACTKIVAGAGNAAVVGEVGAEAARAALRGAGGDGAGRDHGHDRRIRRRGAGGTPAAHVDLARGRAAAAAARAESTALGVAGTTTAVRAVAVRAEKVVAEKPGLTPEAGVGARAESGVVSHATPWVGCLVIIGPG